jgi:surface protein
MFNRCYELKEIKGIDNFNTSQVVNMSSMFECCYKLEYLDLNFNTSNVTDMQFMFSKCFELKEIKGINKFNTCQVIDMTRMFQCCYKLQYLELNFEINDNCVTDCLFYLFNSNCKIISHNNHILSLFNQNN